MKKKNAVDKEDYYNDLNDLTRRVLTAVQVKEIRFADSLKGQDRLDFLKYCSEVVGSHWFQEIFAALMWEFARKGAVEAGSWEEVIVNRAGINGVNTVQEYFEKRARQYKEEFEPEEPKVSAHKAFEPVNIIDTFYEKS